MADAMDRTYDELVQNEIVENCRVLTLAFEKLRDQAIAPDKATVAFGLQFTGEAIPVGYDQNHFNAFWRSPAAHPRGLDRAGLPLAIPAVRSGWIVGDVLTGPKTAWGQWMQILLGRGKRQVIYVVNIAAVLL